MIPKFVSVPAAIFICTIAGYCLGVGMGDWYTYTYHGAAIGCGCMAWIVSDVSSRTAKVEGV